MRTDPPAPDWRGRCKQTRTFASFTGDLEAMADWFTAEGVTAIVMEATGSYWKPVWYLLEDRPSWELKLVNAHHVKILPGRKSDVLDAESGTRRAISAHKECSTSTRQPARDRLTQVGQLVVSGDGAAQHC